MEILPILTAGLGDTSYLLRAAPGGPAVLVDPQRDTVGRLRAEVEGSLEVGLILETHVHNDYLSGALEARSATGAEIAAPAGGGYAFEHRATRDGDALEAGGLRIVALATPGHTPEHLAYLVHEESRPDPVAVLTGGSLIVGGAGRSDLFGPDRALELTRAQWRTLRRLLELPDDVLVLPTHGGGSFCVVGSRSTGRSRTSTIGAERQANPALADAVAGEEAFVRARLGNLPAFPAYYAHMAPINRAGPPSVEWAPDPRPLDPDGFEAAVREGAWLVDGRDRVSFASAHLPGALNIELSDSFASYVGWLVPFGEPVALVLPEPEPDAWERAVTDLSRIGYDRVVGYLRDGVEAWRAAGRPVRSYGVSSVEELCEARRAGRVPFLLDVRQRPEWDRLHLRDSHNLFVADLAARIDEIPHDREVWAMCATGHRSSIAASMLDREGIPVRLVNPGGVRELVAACPEEAPGALEQAIGT